MKNVGLQGERETDEQTEIRPGRGTTKEKLNSLLRCFFFFFVNVKIVWRKLWPSVPLDKKLRRLIQSDLFYGWTNTGCSISIRPQTLQILGNNSTQKLGYPWVRSKTGEDRWRCSFT